LVIGSALSIVLKARGYSLECELGEECRFVKGAVIIEPFKVLPSLVSGELASGKWRQQCAEAGIADANLGGKCR